MESFDDPSVSDLGIRTIGNVLSLFVHGFLSEAISEYVVRSIFHDVTRNRTAFRSNLQSKRTWDDHERHFGDIYNLIRASKR